jgi:isoleucyl-tRNA synthetase
MDKIDYKSTLNLPHTEFPMRANSAQKEPARVSDWKNEKIYEKVREKNKGKEKFILHMGPPYANGDIHLGHALTTILKDIVVKSKTLSGYDAPLVPGWDCHGLPIEINVEKKIGMANVDVTPQVFRKACREYAASQINLQRDSFVRLGIIADWDNPYSTMDYQYEANIVRAIGSILDLGYLHQGYKPVHWCTQCGSSLAEAEVEYQNKESPAIDVCFRVDDVPSFLKAIGNPASSKDLTSIALVIWTTTPWTLPANQAVALHPDLEYALIKADFGHGLQAIVLLKELMDACLARYGCEKYEVVATFQGKQIELQKLQHPFYDRLVPVVLGEHVTVDAGTGAVHTAPGHGLEDYVIGMQYNLPIETQVGGNGCFQENTPLVGGLYVFKANDQIISILKEKNNLLHQTKLDHSYPHCWRHKIPIIFRATSQWFISLDKNHLRQSTIEAINQVEWIPSWGQSRIRGMMENRPDWCVSRQRAWGTPLPLLLHKTTDKLHPQMTEIIKWVADQIAIEGADAWYNLDLATLPFDNIEEYLPLQDVLDVWFDSGVSHTCVLQARPDLQFPADLYLEGSDQHRGWFNSSLLTSMAMYQEPPYRTVLTHGFTLDMQGRKMSKSLGNVIPPEKIVKTLGADVLRLWVAAVDYKSDVHVSEEILTRMSDAYRRIRNTMRFLLANLHGFDPKAHIIPQDQLIALDAWIVDAAARLQEEIIQAYETYQFHVIYQKIHNFCVVELGSFYLDVIKDRQYTTKTNGLPRHSAQTAMFYIVHALTRWLAPILSFTAEEIWELLPGVDAPSVFLTQWLTDIPRLSALNRMDDHYWHQLIEVRECVNKALEKERGQGKIGAPLQACVTLFAEGELYEQLLRMKNELKFVLITSTAVVKPLDQKDAQAMPTERADLWVVVTTSTDEKCARCWHQVPDVNQTPEYPQLCGRCVSNVDPQSSGEVRLYA